MTLQSAPYYWVECDQPGCGVKSTEGGEFAAWGDADQALDDATCSDWITTDDGKHYCFDHVPRCFHCANTLGEDGTCEDADSHDVRSLGDAEIGQKIRVRYDWTYTSEKYKDTHSGKAGDVLIVDLAVSAWSSDSGFAFYHCHDSEGNGALCPIAFADPVEDKPEP